MDKTYLSFLFMKIPLISQDGVDIDATLERLMTRVATSGLFASIKSKISLINAFVSVVPEGGLDIVRITFRFFFFFFTTSLLHHLPHYLCLYLFLFRLYNYPLLSFLLSSYFPLSSTFSSSGSLFLLVLIPLLVLLLPSSSSSSSSSSLSFFLFVVPLFLLFFLSFLLF